MSSRILVTGAAGFIGSHVSEFLASRGDEVVGLDNFDPYYSRSRKRANVDEVKAGPGGARFTLVQGDVRDPETVERVFAKGFDAVAHLAGLAGVRASVENPRHYVDVNVNGTIVLLEAASKAKVKSFVFSSTSSAYGDTRPPFSEDDPADRPLAPYAATKRAAEMLCYTYHHAHGLPCNVVRLFTAYGPRNRPDMMAYKVLDSIFTGREVPLFGGDMVRDWTYVDDVARGIVAALDHPLGYEIFNLGHGHPVRLSDFIATIEDLAGRPAHLVPSPRLDSDALATTADISKAARLLGYESRVSLKEGVEGLFRWYVQHVAGETSGGTPPALRGRAQGE